MKDLDIIFFTARGLMPEAQPAYLDSACAGDGKLRTRLEQMLAVANDAEEFFGDPANADPEAQRPGSDPTRKLPSEITELPDKLIGQKIGRYKILERIGEGGCGVVYIANQTEPMRRNVALKVIKPGMDSRQVIARFEAERQALAMMDHPNIARVLDAGTTDAGRPFFVMELVHGARITEDRDRANLTTQERLELFVKVCQAIQHAHQKGIIHRDIKPSNILVALHDQAPVPKVIDFGIAKATEAGLTEATIYTQLHQFLGTPAYMSPEQAGMNAVDIDTRSDIYSLGVLLYELLVGSTPFDSKALAASGLDAMRKTIREKPPLRPSTKLRQTLITADRRKLNALPTAPGAAKEIGDAKLPRQRFKEIISQLRGDLDWIVMKCLEKDRARRYETASALAMDINRYLKSEPVVARPPSRWYEFQKTARRHKFGFAAATALLVVLSAGVLTSTWQAVRATEAEQAEKAQAKKAGMERDRALRAEFTAVEQRDLAQERLYDSLVREANSIRTIRPLGYRHLLIDRIQKALAIPTARKDLDLLRTEFAQCLGDATSFDPVNLIDPPPDFRDFVIDPEGTQVAFGTAAGWLVILDTITGKATTRLQLKAQLDQLAFAPDGRGLFGLARESEGERPESPRHTSLVEWHRAGDGSWSLTSKRSLPNLRRLVATAQSVIAVLKDSAKQEIQLRNIITNERIGSVPLASETPFPTAFDVTSDHHFAALVAESGTNQPGSIVEVWDLRSNSQRIRLSPGLGSVRRLSFSPDLRFLACSTGEGVLTFETSGFKPVNTYRQIMNSDAIWCGAGSILGIPFAQENGVQLCPVASGLESKRLSTPHQVKHFGSSLDGTVALAIPEIGPMLLVRVEGTRERLHLSGHVGGACCVEFSPDGKTVATTGKDGMIRIWDFAAGKPLQAWAGTDQQLPVQTVAFSPDGRWLASGNYENSQVLVWALKDGRRVLALDGGRGTDGSWNCAFSPDGRLLVAAGNGLRGWELSPRTAGAPSSDPEARELFNDPGLFRNLQFHPSGKWIGFEGGSHRGGRRQSGSFIRGLAPGDMLEMVNTNVSAVQTLGFSPADEALLHMDFDHRLSFWSLQSHQNTRIMPTLNAGESASSYVANFRVSPESTRVAVANQSGRGVDILDLASGRHLYSLPDDPGPIWYLAWHPDGRHLAVARGDGDISVWNLAEVEGLLAKIGLAP